MQRVSKVGPRLGVRKTNPEIEKMMLALGCAIKSNLDLDLLECDPEKQILKSLKYYWQNNSIFFLIYTSLFERLYPYIHVDRLVKLAKNSILSSDEKCLLAAICHKLSKKDPRFKTAFIKLTHPAMSMENPPKNEENPFLIKRWGREESLKIFGAEVREFLIVKNGKLSPIENTLKINPWLKYRALFGPNTRADSAYIILTSTNEMSSSEVSRHVFSTRQAVGKHYKDLMLIRRENFNLKDDKAA